MGYLDVKTATGIYFYVQTYGNISTPENGILRFDRERLNVGRGMNFKSGIFTTPKAGIYTFSFSILKNGFNFEHLDVFIRLNGAKIGSSASGFGTLTTPATLQATLKLKKGDRIDLWKPKSGGLRTLNELCHHFTGWLVEEDLELN